MNRAYKLVWSAISNSWVVASELAKGAKKSSAKTLKIAVVMAAGLTAGVATAAPAANALPTGESVTSGTATFDRSVTNQLTVNQSTSKLITNWNSFDVGSNGKVVFAQPDAASIALNRVTGGSATEIFGQVTANGQLVMVNPNGITFGAGSQVNAASIIGSVLDIQDSDFNAGTLRYSRGAATGSIENKGSLTATSGSVSLLAPTVKNSGTISATGGNVALINADAADLTAADPSITTASSIAGLIQNSGTISATQVSSVGGKILLTGDTSQSGSQIQLAGTLDATTNTNVNGRSILVNGDVHLNGASNVLDLTSTDGYSLTNAAKINLNGANSGFSVNGTAYTVIRDVSQLQAVGSNLTGNYVLGSDIDASVTGSWNNGAGFVPVGDNSTAFSGVLDGLGHSISHLIIDRPSTDYVGLLGKSSNASLRNVTLSDASIRGNQYVGALTGYNMVSGGGVFALSHNRVSGVVTATTANVGGIAGYNTASGSGSLALVSQNFSSATVNMLGVSGNAGGIVGRNSGNSSGTALVEQNYFNGSMNSSGSKTGGIVGLNQSSGGTSNVQNNNVAGFISSSSFDVGGIVGQNYNTGSSVIGNFSAASFGSAGNINFKGGVVGFNDTAIVANNYWNNEVSGLVSGGSGVSTVTNSGLSSAQSTQLSSYSNWGVNIDAQSGTGSIWRIYEGQSGPLLRSLLRPLTLTGGGSKTYDGTAFNGGSYRLSEAADFSKILGIESFSGTALGARNAGTYTMGVSGLYSNQQGYDLSFASGDFVINKRQLVLSASAASKTYDGKLTAAGKPVITGRVRGDAVVGLTQSFADKNAGTGKTVIVNGSYTIRDGNNGNNYEVVLVDSYEGVITPKTLTITAVANSKLYDGGITSASKPVVTGLLTGDRITGLFQQYADKSVDENKTLIIRSGYVVDDGNAGSNYAVTEVSSNDGVITAH